jgi:VIT1/CCC1 family predicted Fe2+/Mn2+ transporter
MQKRMFRSRPLTKGFSFGLTSGIITTLGMIIGLESATRSNVVIIAGILSIAIADAFSDSLGMHISEEATAARKPKEIWVATVYTFIAKFFFAILFIIPFSLLSVDTALAISVFFGITVISIYSYIIAKKQHHQPWKVVGEHLLISFIVIVSTHFVGDIIRYLLG